MASSTRERIAEEALHLFARYGFAAVSIRDISRAVGVKESTLYYHFANKQAILDALLQQVDQIAAAKQARFDAAFEGIAHVTDGAMVYVAEKLLEDYLLHPSVLPLLRMLAMERIHDAAAEARYRRIVFAMPLAQQKRVFQQMMERGLVRRMDPQTVAELYYSIIYSAFSAHCLGIPLTGEELDRARQSICTGVKTLFGLIKTGDSLPG